jgi:hypothetical protein
MRGSATVARRPRTLSARQRASALDHLRTRRTLPGTGRGRAERDSRRTLVAAEPVALDLPEVWGHGSFPASDPPANW